VEQAGSARFWSCAPVRTFIRQRRSGVKNLFPESTEIERVRSVVEREHLGILSDGKDQVGRERLVGFPLLQLIGRHEVPKQKAAPATRIAHVQIQKKEMRLRLRLERRLELNY